MVNQRLTNSLSRVEQRQPATRARERCLTCGFRELVNARVAWTVPRPTKTQTRAFAHARHPPHQPKAHPRPTGQATRTRSASCLTRRPRVCSPLPFAPSASSGLVHAHPLQTINGSCAPRTSSDALSSATASPSRSDGVVGRADVLIAIPRRSGARTRLRRSLRWRRRRLPRAVRGPQLDPGLARRRAPQTTPPRPAALPRPGAPTLDDHHPNARPRTPGHVAHQPAVQALPKMRS